MREIHRSDILLYPFLKHVGMNDPVIYQEFVLAFSDDAEQARAQRQDIDPQCFHDIVSGLELLGYSVLMNNELDDVPTVVDSCVLKVFKRVVI